MKKITTLVIIIIPFLLLLGCSSTTKPNENMFEVGIDELIDIKVNQKFIITGHLKNKSKYAWGITHGSGMFTYEILDSEGELVQQESKVLFRNDIGYYHEIKPKEVYRHNGQDQRSREFYEFVIKKSGEYTVRSKVEFWIQTEDNQDENLIFYSDPYEFSVN